MLICPDCHNRYDTCSTCWGTGYVTDKQAAEYVERPAAPEEPLSVIDMVLLTILMLSPAVFLAFGPMILTG